MDVADGGLSIGGTVAYAGKAALLLGSSLGVVTAGDPAHREKVLRVLEGADVRWLQSERSTTYRNTYTGSGRRQEVLSLARPISVEDIPAPWFGAPIVHLGPLTGEVSAETVHQVGPGALVGVTPQGWMRSVGRDGVVARRVWEEYATILDRADVLVFSEEDVNGPQEVLRYARAARLAIVTKGARGADLHLDGGVTSFPAYPAVEIEPTGAGDVFAAAFLLEYLRTGSPAQACRFACAAGSFVVEGPFVGGMKGDDQVRRRMAGMPADS